MWHVYVNQVTIEEGFEQRTKRHPKQKGQSRADLTCKKRRIEKQEEKMTKREKEQHMRYKCIARKTPNK